MQFDKTTGPRGGFTMIEIMLVTAIIGLLTVLAVPSYIRSRKRSQAMTILDSIRVFEGAIAQYAIEQQVPGTQTISAADVPKFLPYIKTNSQLYSMLPNDLFGNPIALSTIDSPPKLSGTTFNTLSDAAPVSFWSPYYP